MLSIKKISTYIHPYVVCAVFSAISLGGVSNVVAEQPSALSGGPKTIASKDRVSVLIDREIEDTKSFIILKLAVPTDSKVNAFLLSDPPRLVVDFEGASIKKSENFAAPSNGVVKQVRLGAHANKLRVVIDLIKATPPEYEWKAGKRQAIIKILEEEKKEAPAVSPVAAPPATSAAPATTSPQPATPVAIQPTAKLPPAEPTRAPAAATPTIAATVTPKPALPTATAAPVVTNTPSTTASSAASPQPEQRKLADLEQPGATVPGGSVPAAAKSPAKPALPDYQSEGATQPQPPQERLGDLESSKAPPAKGSTTFSIKGYKFEYLPDKTPVLKIALNKPRAQAQISKVDSETYKIEVKDCALENEDLELPQFPPHDFVGFVMVVSESVGKNVEISVSTENDMVLTTSIHDSEIWVKKP